MKSPKKKNDLTERILDLAKIMIEERFFGTRKAFNEERIKCFKHPEANKKFLDEIRRIRKKYDIPKLVPNKDIYCFPIEDYMDCDSRWLFLRDKRDKRELKKEINLMIKNFDLPQNFFNWIQNYILYNQIPPWNPFYNWELPFQVKNNYLQPLTTQEKNYLKSFFRHKLNIKRRPPKDKLKIYKKICQLINILPKNKKRQFRSVDTALETLTKRNVKYRDEVEFKEKKYKETYENLADRIYPDDESFGQSKKFGQRLRKQNQRLKKRIPEMIDKKKFKK